MNDITQLPVVAQQRGIEAATWSALTNSLYPGARPESVALVWDYCKARGLDPLKKPVHVVPMSIKNPETGKYDKRDIIMPGISELRTTAARTGEYAGQDEARFGPMITYLGIEAPEWCSITVYRFVQGQRVGFTHMEYFSEVVAIKKGENGEPDAINSMWSRRTRGQLAKCTEAGALRKAFPEEVGNEYTAEELAGKALDHSEPRAIGEAERVEITMPRRKVPPPDASAAQPSHPVEAEIIPSENAPEKIVPPSPRINASMLKMVKARIAARGTIDEEGVCHQFDIDGLQDITIDTINTVLAWIDRQ